MLHLHCSLLLQVNISSENCFHMACLFVLGFFSFEAIMIKLYRVKTFKSYNTVKVKSHYTRRALPLLAT